LIRLHPVYSVGGVRAKVHEHRLAQRQARQAVDKPTRYVGLGRVGTHKLTRRQARKAQSKREKQICD
jgi:hypothetical protein